MKGKPIFVDVREPQEYSASHVAGAVNLPLSQLAQNPAAAKDLSKDSKLVLYCNSGNRSGIAKGILQAQGYKDVENGINEEYVENNYS